MQLVKQVKSFGGVIKQYSHESASTKCTMKFSIFLPPSASDSNKVPVLFYLAGLTCNDELLFVKAPEAQKVAASRGIAIVTTDTSPRGVSVPGDEDNWDFGTGAGFYVDATEPKWDEHYRMYSYVTKELPALITANFPVLEDKQSIMGHSMGGHGALVLGIRNPVRSWRIEK
jgi:S-formylglutathione hydrolase